MTATIELQQGELWVSGHLNFVTAVQLWNQSLLLLKDEKNIQINLEKVSECNGAGLSLLVEWKRYANSHKKNIQFKNLPENLLSIAKIAGISDFFE